MIRSWPAADAQVLRWEVVPLRTDSGQMLYDTLLVLAYQVNGRPYVSGVGSPHQSTHYESKMKQADRFLPSSRTEVRYNPHDPGDIRIQASYNVHFFAIPILISAVAAIFGLLALLPDRQMHTVNGTSSVGIRCPPACGGAEPLAPPPPGTCPECLARWPACRCCDNAGRVRKTPVRQPR